MKQEEEKNELKTCGSSAVMSIYRINELNQA